MKTGHWLSLSLAANLALAWFLWQPNLKLVRMQSRPTRTPSHANPAIQPTAPQPVPGATSPSPAPAFNWSCLESDRYEIYVANLRAVHCPEQTIRDIILADVFALYAGKVRSVVEPAQSRFWELASSHTNLEQLVETKRKELDALEEERTDLLQRLVGSGNPQQLRQDEETAEEGNAARGQLLDFLPPDKSESVRRFLGDADSARKRLAAEVAAASAADKPAKERETRDFEEHTKASLRAILTAEEWDEYSLRTSPAADRRLALGRFDATEEETRTLARIEMERLQARDQAKASGNESSALIQSVDTLASQKIASLMTPERYADYQRALDPSLAAAADIVERLGLPENTLESLQQTRRDAQETSNQLKNNRSLSAEDRQSLLSAVKAETDAQLNQLLGKEALSAYHSHGGEWVDELARAK